VKIDLLLLIKGFFKFKLMFLTILNIKEYLLKDIIHVVRIVSYHRQIASSLNNSCAVLLKLNILILIYWVKLFIIRLGSRNYVF